VPVIEAHQHFWESGDDGISLDDAAACDVVDAMVLI
jgi:hypothetical protein